MLSQADLTALERTVIETLFKMYPADEATLRAQFSEVTVRSRTNTRAGFYTQLDVSISELPALDGLASQRGGPNAFIEGLRNGMGFILWLENGYANCIEGYSFDENTAAIDFEGVRFEIDPHSTQVTAQS